MQRTSGQSDNVTTTEAQNPQAVAMAKDVPVLYAGLTCLQPSAKIATAPGTLFRLPGFGGLLRYPGPAFALKPPSVAKLEDTSYHGNPRLGVKLSCLLRLRILT